MTSILLLHKNFVVLAPVNHRFGYIIPTMMEQIKGAVSVKLNSANCFRWPEEKKAN